MSLLVYFFGSGLAFFVGVTFVLGGLALSPLRRWSRLTPLTSIFGLILVAVSAAPLPYAFYAVAAVVTVGWLIVERFKRRLGASRLRAIRLCTALLWLGGFLMELPYHSVPTITAPGRPTLWVVGDSVTAGMGDRK